MTLWGTDPMAGQDGPQPNSAMNGGCGLSQRLSKRAFWRSVGVDCETTRGRVTLKFGRDLPSEVGNES